MAIGQTKDPAAYSLVPRCFYCSALHPFCEDKYPINTKKDPYK